MLDDAAVATFGWLGACRAARDYLAVAPCGLSPVLAMEIAKDGRAAEDRARDTRPDPENEP